MRSFNQYFEDKQLAEEKRERDIVEKKRKAKLEEETHPSGWGIFKGNPEITNTFIKWVTRNK